MFYDLNSVAFTCSYRFTRVSREWCLMKTIIISQGLSFLSLGLITMSQQVGGHCVGVGREFSILTFFGRAHRPVCKMVRPAGTEPGMGLKGRKEPHRHSKLRCWNRSRRGKDQGRKCSCNFSLESRSHCRVQL